MDKNEFDQTSFLGSLGTLKSEFDIREIPQAVVTNQMKRRVTILVTDEFILAGGGIHQAFFFESCLYHHLKKESFNCEELPIESQEYEKKVKARKGFNPVKLVSETYVWEDDSPCLKALVKQVIIKLKKKVVKTDEPRRLHLGKRFVRGIRHQQRHTKKPQTARTTVFQPK